jgi:hypothetical protein
MGVSGGTLAASVSDHATAGAGPPSAPSPAECSAPSGRRHAPHSYDARCAGRVAPKPARTFSGSSSFLYSLGSTEGEPPPPMLPAPAGPLPLVLAEAEVTDAAEGTPLPACTRRIACAARQGRKGGADGLAGGGSRAFRECTTRTRAACIDSTAAPAVLRKPCWANTLGPLRTQQAHCAVEPTPPSLPAMGPYRRETAPCMALPGHMRARTPHSAMGSMVQWRMHAGTSAFPLHSPGCPRAMQRPAPR